MKLTSIFILVAFLHVNASTFSQNISIKGNNMTLKEVFKQMGAQTGYGFLYNPKLLNSNIKVRVNLKNVPLKEALAECLNGQALNYSIVDKTILISPLPAGASISFTDMVAPFVVKGRVTNEKGEPLAGATVQVKHTKTGTKTNDKGTFELSIPDSTRILEVSYIGYEKQEVLPKRNMLIRLTPKAAGLNEVTVSTGYFTKSKESFTGSELTIKGDDLRRIGYANVLQSLSAYDPAIQMKENIEFGSDPNRVPDLTIRGENSFDLRGLADDGKTNPNAPLFILDGVQTEAERIYDLDMNRIDNITILKDAAATALYGSRGANGVIVIRTIRPRPGQIKISLNANFIVSAPDLRDYNLMNSAEKLQYEKLAGVWTNPVNNYEEQLALDIKYNEKMKDVLRGVDTYWLSKPLTTSVNQRYNLYLEGGDQNFRYGISLRNEDDKGIMKGSDRNKTGIGVVFNYDIGDNFFVRNDLLIDEVKGNNSPYGSFDNFARQNPHDRIFAQDGGYLLTLSSGNFNPLINATLPQKDYSKYTSIQDNFSIDWRIIPELRLQGRMSLSKRMDKTEYYRSPGSSEFASELLPEKRGKYTGMNSEQVRMDGNMTLAYIKVFDKSVINAGIGTNVMSDSKEGNGFTATGFLNDNMTFIEYAAQFEENSKPKGIFDKSRMLGLFANLNYGYDNRYFIDASYRTDGSSKFGRDSRFAPFWAVGLAWNVNREKFWGDNVNTLKVRGSVGSTGTTNFSSSQALTTYRYSQNSDYNGVLGAQLMGYGNSSLKWQNTLSYNVGVDMSLFQNFMQLNIDGYIKLTDNLLLPIDVAPSTGFASYVENMGQMKNTGIDFRLRFNVIRNRQKDLNWNITLAAITNKNKIQKLSNALEVMNAEANKLENVVGPQPLRTYEVGRSQSALMVVRSAGIDPATGNEIFIKRSGEYTFDYDYRDKVIAGDTRPTLEGNISNNINWKGFNLYALLQYRIGGKIFNSTLKTKVEGANPIYNADRRVLYDRWQSPGSAAKYKRIDDTSDSYQTTRFVQDNNSLNLGSLSLTYDLPARFTKKMRAERVRVMFSTTDLFRIATVKAERGTMYPYAKTFNAGLNVSF
ncbi:SusC/RagA family TonB-linked outer membrane protein [Pedobacter nyackensis]|uniref:SusC/RagA family TonB-linked outer membrane protein n=1 Tax=Pedobacter nyackensis TaxID=475255 RepID=UPI00292D902C|nr:SusC/RagA family TonB-linked outer membrane protein [Pedobacter nyackensis]